ncbi:DExH-box ATP-dependent RNA helicase DExH12-like [Apium graveolens]|uniref:DExH-box ATP-dependent RNA helicase DExH12-like n=1 Tax=Apium graveolens TaxID=4045 RepID=UPI003D79F64A
MAISTTIVFRRDSGAPRNHDRTMEDAYEISSFLNSDIIRLLGPALASKHKISHTTIERFSTSLTEETELKGLLEILTSADEFARFSVRPGEEELIRDLLMNNPRFSFDNPNCRDSHVKAKALLLAHFSRQPLSGDLAADQEQVLVIATRLVPALVDVIFLDGSRWLANCAMKVSQMVTQGTWESDSMLLQLPYFSKELAQKCEKNPGGSVTTVFDLVELEDNERRELLQLSDAQWSEIAKICNRIPDINLAFNIPDREEIRAGEVINVEVFIERNLLWRTDKVGPVYAPRYPKLKQEGWWLMVTDAATDELLSMKRVYVKGDSNNVRLDFAAPGQTGRKWYAMYATCDSYIGCDVKYYFSIDVKGTGARNEEDYMEE